MGEAQKSVDKFMKWLVEDKWNVLNPHPMRTLYTEFAAVFGNEEAYHRNMYMDEEIKPLIETCGNLVLDPDGHRVNFFTSFDGKVWSGVHRKWHGKSKKVENEEDGMAPVGEEDKAQRTQEAQEEKFWRQHDIEVAEMSEKNKIQDRMDAQAFLNNFS